MRDRSDKFTWQDGDLEIHQPTGRERHPLRPSLRPTGTQEQSWVRPDQRGAPTEPTSPQPGTRRKP